jgi:hypothetical protein
MIFVTRLQCSRKMAQLVEKLQMVGRKKIRFPSKRHSTLAVRNAFETDLCYTLHKNMRRLVLYGGARRRGVGATHASEQ